jgi:hypothetical protein
MSYELTASFHKGTCSSAHLGHNRRTIKVPHADKDRQSLNVCYVDMSLSEAYDILFADALAEYNEGKKPSRQIKDYLAHIHEQYEKGEVKLQEARARGASKKEQALIKSRYPKTFYEVIVSIGNRDSYGGVFRCGGENEQVTVDILNEYMRDFQERNPNLFVFSAYLHRDEMSGIPHIHIDYIPFTTEPGRGLPVRLSENGAFRQMGLTSGQYGEYGTVAFQKRERDELTDIAKRHGIDIVEGQHSKTHLSKEEYILRQEQEKNREAQEIVESQAKELLYYQDEFLDYISSGGIEDAFLEHIENISLKQDKASYEMTRERQRRFLASSWDEYNSATKEFFSAYRNNKAVLWAELTEARKRQQYNKKKLTRTIDDIIYGTDFLVVKLIKLCAALFMLLDNVRYENQVEELQEANRRLKETARSVMQESAEVSTTLRLRDIEHISEVIRTYENKLNATVEFINETIGKIQHLDMEEVQK